MGTLYPQKASERQGIGMRTADQEIKLRVPEAVKQLLKDAAVIENMSLSQFMLETATARAKQVVAEVEFARMTLLPPRFFDELQANLDEPEDVPPALLNAFRRLSELDLDLVED